MREMESRTEGQDGKGEVNSGETCGKIEGKRSKIRGKSSLGGNGSLRMRRKNYFGSNLMWRT